MNRNSLLPGLDVALRVSAGTLRNACMNLSRCSRSGLPTRSENSE
jgi:hypothetical protein